MHGENLSPQILQRTRVRPVIEGQTVGPKALFLLVIAPIRLAPAILPIPQQGAAQLRHGHADLVGPAGQQLALHQRQPVPLLERFIIGDGGAPAGYGTAVKGDFLFLLPTPS